MDRLERERRAIRNSFKKTKKELEDALNANPTDKTVIDALMLVLTSDYEKLNEVSTKIFDKMQEDNVGEDDLDSEMHATKGCNKDLAVLSTKVTSPATAVPDDIASQVSFASPSQGYHKIKLSKIELQKYDGDLKKWLGWWSQFQKIHTNQDLDDADKIQYLNQHMVPKPIRLWISLDCAVQTIPKQSRR